MPVQRTSCGYMLVQRNRAAGRVITVTLSLPGSLDLKTGDRLLLDLSGGRFREEGPREHERGQQDVGGRFPAQDVGTHLSRAAAGRSRQGAWRDSFRLVRQHPPLRTWVCRVHQPFRAEGRFRQLDSVVYVSMRRVPSAIRPKPQTGVRVGIGRLDALLDATGRIRDQYRKQPAMVRSHGFDEEREGQVDPR